MLKTNHSAVMRWQKAIPASTKQNIVATIQKPRKNDFINPLPQSPVEPCGGRLLFVFLGDFYLSSRPPPQNAYIYTHFFDNCFSSLLPKHFSYNTRRPPDFH